MCGEFERWTLWEPEVEHYGRTLESGFRLLQKRLDVAGYEESSHELINDLQAMRDLMQECHNAMGEMQVMLKGKKPSNRLPSPDQVGSAHAANTRHPVELDLVLARIQRRLDVSKDVPDLESFIADYEMIRRELQGALAIVEHALNNAKHADMAVLEANSLEEHAGKNTEA